MLADVDGPDRRRRRGVRPRDRRDRQHRQRPATRQRRAHRPLGSPAASTQRGCRPRTARGCSVTGGELTDVSLHAVGSSVDVAGTLSGDTWRQTDPLVPATRYVLEAAAVNADDRGTHRSWRFRTAEPAVTDLPAVSPLAGSEVGVGHPVVVSFDHPVTDKSAVEAGLDVRTSRPVTGAWGWLDDQTVAWRPREFWPGQTDVSVRLDLAGTELRPRRVGDGGPSDRLPGRPREQVLRVTDATHTMTVERAGEHDPHHAGVARQARLHHPLRRQGDHDPAARGADDVGRDDRPERLRRRGPVRHAHDRRRASSCTRHRGRSGRRAARTSRTAARTSRGTTASGCTRTRWWATRS